MQITYKRNTNNDIKIAEINLNKNAWEHSRKSTYISFNVNVSQMGEASIVDFSRILYLLTITIDCIVVMLMLKPSNA